MQLNRSRPLITGAARGIGRAFVDAFLEAGAEVVYAGVRDEAAARRLAAADPRVRPILLDTTHPHDVAAAARAAPDVDILVNNAGVSFNASFLNAPSLDAARQEIEVNFFGPLAMARAFAPSLVDRRGAIVNILSVAALVHIQSVGSYNASKGAARAMTLGLRGDLRASGVRVLAVYPGGYDTDMAYYVEDKSRLFQPSLLTAAVIEALADGGPDDVFPDPAAQNIRRMLREDPEGLAALMSGASAKASEASGD